MKKVFYFALALSTFSLASCERCATCTSISDDPRNNPGEEIEVEVCGTGSEYDDQIEIYTRTNWECEEI